MSAPYHDLKIVAVVGLSGVGKTAAVSLLEQSNRFRSVYFGGIVLDEVLKRGLKVNPENEAAVREELRELHGMAVIAARSVELIESIFETDSNVLVDGLYSYSEYKFLQERFGSAVQLIAVHARKSVRAKRLGDRAVRPLTYQQMIKRDDLEISRLEKAEPIALADYHVVNDAGLHTFQSALTECLNCILRGQFDAR